MPSLSGWFVKANVRSLLIAGGVSLALQVTACAPESLTRDDSSTASNAVSASQVGDSDLIPLIEADLTCLYSTAGLLPNESSSVGKFRSIVTAIQSGDLAGAQDAAAKLISFIELKYSQFRDKSAIIACGDPVGTIPLTELKDRAIARINAFVSLGGNVCEIPEGSPETFCRSGDNQTALVYFPPGLFDKLTFVSIEENPAGFTSLQDLGFDEYPAYVRIQTEPLTDFRNEPVKPLVFVCFNEAVVPADQTLRDRLLLGHRHTALDGTVSFRLLPPPDFDVYGDAVLAEVENFCSGGLASTGGQPFPVDSRLGRLGNRVAQFFAPSPLQAVALAARGGVGGSAEEFSEFGAIDKGISAFGGIGGSAEEFVRAGVVANGMAAAQVSSDGSTVTGKVGVDTEVTDPAELPRVRLVSPGSNNPVAGVTVNFQLLDPVTVSPTSEASFCGSTTAVTDDQGEASPACINFGDKVGFKNLKVTFDPTGVDAEACIIDVFTGVCATETTSINFLIATIAGNPARLALVNAPGATSARAGLAMDPQPILQVQDAGGNDVASLDADIPVTATVTRADGSAGGTLSSFTATTDRSTGRLTISGLALGGTVGTTYKLIFGAPAFVAAMDTVTITSAGTAAALTVTPTTANAAAGGLVPAVVASVRDAFGNGVAGATVTVSSPDLACFSGTPGCTARTTDAAGNASFADLTIQGPGAARTLTFASGALPTATVALTLTPGSASAIIIDQPASGDYGSGLPIGPVTPDPRVKVTDAFGNPVVGAGVNWSLASSTNGSAISAAATSTGVGGLSSITWRLGDGDNGLRATLGSTNDFVNFLAASATGGVSLSCAPSSRVRKIDLGGFDAAKGGYVGNFSMQPELAARFRQLTLFMSVTGQSSGTGDYPAVLRVYRGTKSAANLLATGVPANPNGIQLAGDNGSFAPVQFTLTPNAASSVAPSGNNNFVLFELEVTAPATRTLQLWYNQQAGGGTCGGSILYAPGVTNFQNAASRDITRGLLITVRN